MGNHKLDGRSIALESLEERSRRSQGLEVQSNKYQLVTRRMNAMFANNSLYHGNVLLACTFQRLTLVSPVCTNNPL